MAKSSSVLTTQVREGAAQLVAAAVIIVGAYSVNGLFGLSFEQTAVLGVVFVAMTYVVVTSESELSFPFIASAVAVLIAVWQFVLDPLLGDAVPVEAWFAALGVDITELDALTAGFITTVAILAYWIIQIRAGGGAKNADSVAKRLQKKVEKLFGTYATIGRVTASIGLAFVFILFAEGGVLAGEFASYLGNAPLVVSNVVALITGYLSLGGSVPYLEAVPLLGALTSGEFAVLAGVVLLLAAGARYS